MDLKDIQNLIKFVAKSGATEVKLEIEDVKITIKTTMGTDGEPTTYIRPISQGVIPQQLVAQQPITTPTSESSTTTDTSDKNSKYVTIKSPIIGTFYRRPSPDKPVFVEVGSNVVTGDILCVIEAMKLFNEIESEFSGKIVKVLVDDASPVEFDQPLFLIDPN